MAVFYFTLTFDWTFGLLLSLAMTAHFCATITLTKYAKSFRKQANDFDNTANAHMVENFAKVITLQLFGATDSQVPSIYILLLKNNLKSHFTYYLIQ